MANTYTQIHIQYVFAVKFRDAVITQEWEERLHQYMTGIVQKYNHKVLAINGMPDHVHILVGMRPTQAPSDLMEQLKSSSSKWINEEKFLKTKFAWQDGFSAFSYTKSHVQTVIRYIFHQIPFSNLLTFSDIHLKMRPFYDVPFDLKYIESQFVHVILYN